MYIKFFTLFVNIKIYIIKNSTPSSTQSVLREINSIDFCLFFTIMILTCNYELIQLESIEQNIQRLNDEGPNT